MNVRKMLAIAFGATAAATIGVIGYAAGKAAEQIGVFDAAYRLAGKWFPAKV